jgi:hypothetical protein
MQHKLYDKLVARLNDGTISVNTVKHPVSFGQVAVLVGCGEVHSNSLAGATSAESSAYDSAKVIINSVPSSSIDKISIRLICARIEQNKNNLQKRLVVQKSFVSLRIKN